MHAVAAREREGAKNFQREADARVVAVARFSGKIAPEVAASLRAPGFRRNCYPGQWQGKVEFADAKKTVEQAGGKMQTASETPGWPVLTPGGCVMAKFWDSVLTVIQGINTYGGNFISAFICRAVIDEIDRMADAGDEAMLSKRKRMEKEIKNGKWPDDQESFSAFFETYHEALFYILAIRRGLHLQPIAEETSPTADFRTSGDPIEQFELKTINFSGGARKLESLMEKGLDSIIALAEKAKRNGIATGEQVINPHGDAKNNFEAIQRVMGQIANNIKAEQFSKHPTFLVVPMIRTALRAGPDELLPRYRNAAVAGEFSGHLWTIAANSAETDFWDWDDLDDVSSFGEIGRAGILLEFPFIRGVVFVRTEWNILPGCDSSESFPENAFGLFGIWNDDWDKGKDFLDVSPDKSSFTTLCHAWNHSKPLGKDE